MFQLGSLSMVEDFILDSGVLLDPIPFRQEKNFPHHSPLPDIILCRIEKPIEGPAVEFDGLRYHNELGRGSTRV